MTKPRLLVVEDDPRLRRTLRQEFTERAYTVAEADSLETIPDEGFDFALVDLRLRGESGLRAIPVILARSPDCRIVALTGFGSIASAVEAIKLGAVNYLTKPASIERIEAALLGADHNVTETPEPMSLSRKEHEYIEYMLIQHDGNIAKTAKALGLHRQSLQRKLKKQP